MLNSKKNAFILGWVLNLLVYEQNHVQSCKLGLESIRRLFTVGTFVPPENLGQCLPKVTPVGATSGHFGSKLKEKYNEYGHNTIY